MSFDLVLAVDMEWLSIILAVVVGLLISIFWYNKRPKNFPPGPMALPLVGYYPFLGKRACETLTDLGKKFGSIYSLKMGTRDILVLNDWRSVKEALLNQNEIFAGRPVTYTFDEVRARTGEFLINTFLFVFWGLSDKFLKYILYCKHCVTTVVLIVTFICINFIMNLKALCVLVALLFK